MVTFGRPRSPHGGFWYNLSHYFSSLLTFSFAFYLCLRLYLSFSIFVFVFICGIVVSLFLTPSISLCYLFLSIFSRSFFCRSVFSLCFSRFISRSLSILSFSLSLSIFLFLSLSPYTYINKDTPLIQTFKSYQLFRTFLPALR